MIVSAISRTALVAHGDAELPAQMLRQALRRGNKFVEGRLFDDFVLAATLAAATVEILVEKRSDVELVEGVRRLGFRHFFRLGFDECFFAVIFAHRLVFGELL